MIDFLSIAFPCVTRRKPWLNNLEKPVFLQGDEKTPHLTCEEAARQIVDALFLAGEGGATLSAHINGIAHQAGGWSEWLAEQVRKGIEEALIAGKEMDGVFATAYQKACAAAMVFEQFAEEHPLATAIFVTVIAIGVLVILAPYVVELLGFGELGPIEGTWAALWQAAYRGFVPKGSLFSYLQRLGMTWK